MTSFKNAPFVSIKKQQYRVNMRSTGQGVLYLEEQEAVRPTPYRMTARLAHWAEKTPDKVFLGDQEKTISYREAYELTRNVSQWILDQGATPDKPIAILAENSLEHGIMALAALHVGIPYAAITPAYATKASDYAKLKHALDLLQPSILLISQGSAYEKALQAVDHQAIIVYIEQEPAGDFEKIAFENITQTIATKQVDLAHQAIQPNTLAKILFTSGSTGLPKGVMNTHENVTTNWQQITQVFPFFEEGFTLIDWLPWNHTFGGNHNFGLTLYHGGSLFIDGGNPTPAGTKITVENIRKIAPTIYFNVPKGFEELLPYLREDADFRARFFKNLKLLFYAGAGMSQAVWDALEELSVQETGKRVFISTGLGCTESSPSALFNTHEDSFSGLLGVPVSGLSLKLVPNGGKLEARFKGKNVMPGYWKNPAATAAAFDEEGYYQTGDALKFVDPLDPNRGLIFDGRIAEDFKLDTGTWVSVSTIRAAVIAASQGKLTDIVITGHDRSFVGLLVFSSDISNEMLAEVLSAYNKTSRGSSTYLRRAMIVNTPLSLELGELTEKGSINQRAVLTNRKELVEQLYAKEATDNMLVL